MAVLITEECINCEACAPECPVAAILEDTNDRNPYDNRFYVKPEACVECVDHADQPRCAEACPTEGAIVWDMPYTEEFNEYYKERDEEGIYKIRVHKKKGIMLPEIKTQKFVADISIEDRENHANLGNW